VRNVKRSCVSLMLAPVLVVACLAGMVPGDVACCAGWMPLHGADCCAGRDAASRHCCDGEDGLQQPDRSVTASVLPSALCTGLVSPPAALSAGPEPVPAPGPFETAPTPLYHLHASLLL
jgi:hypothetical protein